MTIYARAGDILSRRKGLVMHRGVSLGGGRVLHNTPFRGEHICSEAEFRSGQRMYVSRPESRLHQVVLRESNLPTGRSYNLLTNNCEHTVSRVTLGKSESPQLRSLLVGAGMALATFALTRHPAATAAAYAFGHKLAKVRSKF
ncbi:MAG: hypothetical protein GXP16_07060 [Gammaproteobacteria bacterium]|nr:hypothetical protein [Gammaproteobacteria bacterium]